MNNVGGALNFNATLNLNEWRRNVDQIRRDLLGLNNFTAQQTTQMDSSFRNLAVGVSSYFSFHAIKDFTLEVIKVRGEFQMMENAIETITGSKSKMDQLMAEWKDLTLRSPFRLSEIGQAGKQLLAYGIDVNKVTHDIEMLGNVAAGVSAPIGDIAYVYGTLKTQGRAYTRDILQFTMRGIPIMGELAKVMGVSVSEMKGLIEAGKVGFPEVEKAMNALTSEGGKFNNLIGKQATTLTGAVNRLKHEFELMLNEIGSNNEAALSGGISSLTHLVENYKDVSKTIFELIAAYGIYKAAVITSDVFTKAYNMTIQSEIALLGISEKMKLGRAMVTQRQAEATARETAAELANTRAKYSSLQIEVSSLAVKRQSAIQSGINATAKAQEAAVQLSLARMELSSLQATGTAREIEIAQKRVATAQNTVIATQETASIARKRALAVSTEFNAAKQQLENTAQAVGIAEKTAATAAETAQIAAKNANAIATTRLTVVQRIQVITSQAAASAQSFLNRTILANPYAAAAVLLAALTYAVYKQANALTALQEIQQKFKEELARTNIGVNETVTKINSLVATIKKQSTSYDEAKGLLNQVNKLTDNRIKGLTVEAIKTGQADEAVKRYTKTLYRQAEAMLKVQEIAKLEEELKKLNEDLASETFAEKFNATFNIFDDNYYKKGWQGAKEERKKAIQKTISDYKSDVEKAIKDGININGESATVEEKPYSPAKFTEEWYDQEIERLEALKKKAVVGSKKWNQYKAEIERIRNLVSPKKQKEENQIAEIFPIGSPKQIEQQIQLLDDAIAVVDKGMVKIRKLDKYGHDKNKQGDPFLTGEIISLEEANKRRIALKDKYDEASYKTSQEKFDLAKKQWENYYKSIEYFGKDEADKMYQGLFKGSNSFLQYIDTEIEALEKRKLAGEKLGKSDNEYLLNLIGSRNSLIGIEEPIEAFKREFENTLKLMPSYVDQIDAIDKAIDDIFQKSGGRNTDLYLSQKRYLEETKRGVLQQQKDLYSQFVVEQETFEEKKLQIERKYNNIRAQMGENTALSDSERLRLLDAAGKAEAKEYRDAFVSVLEKSDMFEKVFGNIDALTKKEISKYIPELEAKINELINLGAPAQEVEKFREKLEKLKDVSKSSGPITRLIGSFKELRKKIREGTATQEDFNRLNQHLQETKFYTDLAVNSAKELSEALGIDGKGGPFEKFAKDLTQTIEGLINAIVGYFTKNVQQMVGGIAQMVVGVVKMLSTAGDGKKEKSIREWKRAVDELKASYEELQRVIEKTAGEAQLSKQRELISNLKEQQNLLVQMRDKEAQKKKKDVDKIASYNQQINDVNIKIKEIVDDFQKSVTTTDFKDLSQKLADSLITAFAQGEDAAKSFDKVVDDVMKNAVVNALRIKYLEPVVQEMIDKLYSSMGYGQGDTSEKFAQIKQYEEEIKKLDEKIKNNIWGNLTNGQFEDEKKKYLQLIDKLKAEIANTNISGSFDGLTPDEIKQLKDYKNDPRYKAFLESIKSIDEVFENTTAAAQGLKGDIKGITEKTAGALEGQINAMRIMQAEALKRFKDGLEVMRSQLLVQSQIEMNTRPIKGMYDEIKSMNSKIKNGLAGI